MLTSAADRSLAAALAALLEERDPFTGAERPADLALRIDALNGNTHQLADSRGLDRVRRSAKDLMRRAGGRWEDPDPSRAGETLALAYPDRLAIRRGSPGRFQLRTGTTAFVANDDPLATERFLIAADLDGKRKDARIRLAAAIDAEAVAWLFADEVDLQTKLTWDGDRLVERTERRLGGFSIDTIDRSASEGPETTKALLARVRKQGWRSLDQEGKADALRERVAFLRVRDPDRWPDWSEKGLLGSLEEWLGPRLGATLDLDVVPILRRSLNARELDRLAPTHLQLANGQRVSVGYQDGAARISMRVRDLYGIDQHPRLAGFPVVIELLSPANRPVQVTSDLPGFWRGSWAAVRKEMQARYPKHPWPPEPWK
jgi:ATP-dependent helicase HrpB